MNKQQEAIEILLKSTEYGGELSAHRDEIVTVIELIGWLEAKCDELTRERDAVREELNRLQRELPASWFSK